jgi:hypothetical protein
MRRSDRDEGEHVRTRSESKGVHFAIHSWGLSCTLEGRKADALSRPSSRAGYVIVANRRRFYVHCLPKVDPRIAPQSSSLAKLTTSAAAEAAAAAAVCAQLVLALALAIECWLDCELIPAAAAPRVSVWQCVGNACTKSPSTAAAAEDDSSDESSDLSVDEECVGRWLWLFKGLSSSTSWPKSWPRSWPNLGLNLPHPLLGLDLPRPLLGPPHPTNTEARDMVRSALPEACSSVLCPRCTARAVSGGTAAVIRAANCSPESLATFSACSTALCTSMGANVTRRTTGWASRGGRNVGECPQATASPCKHVSRLK